MNCLIPQMAYIEILLGQALDIEIPVINRDTGEPVDLDLATVRFLIGKGAEREEINVTTQGHQITVPISSAQSSEWGVGASNFVCWVIIDGAHTPVARGRLNIKPDTRT